MQYPNGACSPAVKTLSVQATGGTTSSPSFDTGAGNTFTNMMWQLEGYSFKATSTTTVLTFDSTTVGAFGPALDLVTVTETVATGAMCKDDGWQGMRDGDGVLFKNQGACVSFYAKSGATPIGN